MKAESFFKLSVDNEITAFFGSTDVVVVVVVVVEATPVVVVVVAANSGESSGVVPSAEVVEKSRLLTGSPVAAA